MFFTNRSYDVRAIAVVSRRVVIADWLFTTPTAVIQPATGFYLLHLAGMPLSARWVVWSIALYIVAGACWLPVVWIQIQMAKLARHAADSDEALPQRFWRYHLTWTLLGIPAFVAFVAISSSQAVAGTITRETLVLYALGVPFMVAGLWSGFKLFGKINDETFRRTVLALLLLAGLSLIASVLSFGLR